MVSPWDLVSTVRQEHETAGSDLYFVSSMTLTVFAPVEADVRAGSDHDTHTSLCDEMG